MAHYIFIDLNGTLIGDSQKDLQFDPVLLAQFQVLVEELRAKKVYVGICSDSPLPQLKLLCKTLGLDSFTPILAENGNLYFNGTKTIPIRSFTPNMLETIRQTALSVAGDLSLIRVDDVIAPEFGGKEFDVETHWGIGANRTNSFSLFGSEELISKVGAQLDIIFSNPEYEIGVDCAPAHNYLGAHPIVDFRDGKKLAMQWVLDNSSLTLDSIWMIGDSKSDWMGIDNPKIRSCFVNQAKISEEMADGAFKVSQLSTLAGVNDLLESIRDSIQLSTPGNSTPQL